MVSRDDALKWSFFTMLIGGLLVALRPFLAGGDGAATWAYLVGGLVLAAAVGVRVQSEKATAWGTTSILAGAFGVAVLGGVAIGALAAIAGGGLAVAADKGIGVSAAGPR